MHPHKPVVTMDEIEIRRVISDDIEALQEIGKQTFYETFADGNTPENMAKYLEEGFSREKLAAELSEAGTEFFFAMLDSRIIGYLKLNSGASQTELKEQTGLEIERIYVLKEFHGKKVGQILYNKALQTALEKKAEYIWLGVWEKNPRAISFYRKNGFVEFDKHVFVLGNDRQTDIMMKLQM